jgi:hypothetical protein
MFREGVVGECGEEGARQAGRMGAMKNAVEFSTAF